MKDYYTPLKPLHETVKRAVKNIEAFRCSQLGQEVYDIKNTFNGLKIDASNWGDSVADSFVEVKNQFVKHFGDIVDSIDGEFSESEKIYRELDDDLEMLYRTNDAYHKYKQEEPDPNEYYDVITKTDRLTGKKTVTRVKNTEKYNEAHQEWQGYFDGLKNDLDELEAKINEEKARLDEINDISISVDAINMNLKSSVENFSTALKSIDTLENYLDRTTGRVITLPAHLGNSHTYMGWQKITCETSRQYDLRDKAGEKYDSEGFARIGDRYVVATTTTYGNVGDYIDIYQDDGTVIKAIIGDIKNQNDDGCTKWGHQNGNCVVEFVVDCKSWYNSTWKKGKHVNPGTDSCHPEWNRNITQVVNKGNYFDLQEEYSV